ncbi:hypothetical protein AB0A63_36865 [Lentzea sp. NPDC042327]|uniref:hypothetical protein n=1 Tax=Lentzea sp. NPDC042327 TaxID=3154801 RepID=UPI0033E3083D
MDVEAAGGNVLKEPEGLLWPVAPASTPRAEPGGMDGGLVAHSHGQRLDHALSRVTSGLTATGPCRKLPSNSNLHAVMAEGFTRRDRAAQQA